MKFSANRSDLLRLLVSQVRSVITLLVPVLLGPALRAQQPAASTETPSSPSSVKSIWNGYAVIQTLPTRQRARTLAVNPETGQVYLVTDLLGVNLAKTGGIGSLQTNPVNGSFQVLVVGN